MSTELTPVGGMKQDDIVAELVEAGHDELALAELTWGAQIKLLTAHRATAANQPPPLFIGMPTTKDYIFDGHAGAGPSGAERWMTCTASLGASRSFLENLTPNQQAEFARAGTAARQGTTAHAAAALEAMLMLGTIEQNEYDNGLLELSLEPDDTGEAYDDEMAEWLVEYGDLIKQYADEGHEVLIESRVEAAIPLMTVDADGDPHIHVIAGSADKIALPTPEKNVLTVTDLKYGNGINVSVDENPQVRIYGLGALALLANDDGSLPDIDHIEYIIVQPRLGGIKTWTESIDDLLDWRDNVLSPALTEALGGAKAGAAFNPSETACHWCPARGGCAALAESRVAAAADFFDVVVEAEFEDGPGAFPETGSLTDDRLGALLAQVEGLTKIKDDLKAEAQRRLFRGGSVPGYQLVNYTPPRKWKEGAKIPAALPIWKDPVPLTPTQALKALGDDATAQARIEKMIDVPPKRPVVAPVGDRRKTWEGRAPEDMFNVETQTGDES